MHRFFFTKGIYRVVIILCLCLAVMLVPSPCHAGKKKKVKAKATKARTTKVAAQTQSALPRIDLKKEKKSKAAAIKARTTAPAARTQTCLPGIPFKDEVSRYVGIPYRRGGDSDYGLDCSGLAQRFFAEVHGIQLPHNSTEQSRVSFLKEVPSDIDAFEASDLLFFGPGKKRINHVGIYLSDGKFLHASPKKGVVISSLDEIYWQKRLITSRRLKNRSVDLESIKSKTQRPSHEDRQDTDAVAAEQMVSLGYNRELIESMVDLNLGAFHATSLTPADPGAGLQEGLAEGYSRMEHRQGFRAYMDIVPSQWLRITPSLSMIDESGSYSQDDSLQIYGLETAIAPPQSPWSLALSAHSSRHSDLYPWRLHEFESPQRTFELAFNVGYRLSGSATLSLYGSRGTTTEDINGSETGGNVAGGLNDLALRLHWSF
jgi:cell wall-associated NlpC family hydrolase